MSKEEKLKKVFDFIADYICDEEVSHKEYVKDVDETLDSEDTDLNNEKDELLRHSHELMRKMDEIKKREAHVRSAIKKTETPLIKSIQQLKEEAENEFLNDKKKEDMGGEEVLLSEAFGEKTGITLNDEGKLVAVNVNPIGDNRTNEEVLRDAGVISKNN